MKIVVSLPKTGKARSFESDGKPLIGKKIGEKVNLDFLGLTGYEGIITGGSDKDGFPMRKEIEGTGRKRILLSKGPGVRKLKKGKRLKKTVRGNTISEEIAQVNIKITKEGTVPFEEGTKDEKKENNEEKKE